MKNVGTENSKHSRHSRQRMDSDMGPLACSPALPKWSRLPRWGGRSPRPVDWNSFHVTCGSRIDQLTNGATDESVLARLPGRWSELVRAIAANLDFLDESLCLSFELAKAPKQENESPGSSHPPRRPPRVARSQVLEPVSRILQKHKQLQHERRIWHGRMHEYTAPKWLIFCDPSFSTVSKKGPWGVNAFFRHG